MGKKKQNDFTVETPVEAPVVDSVPAEVSFNKAQLVASKAYAPRRDLLSALLEDGRQYTRTEVDALIAKFDHTDFTERKV